MALKYLTLTKGRFKWLGRNVWIYGKDERRETGIHFTTLNCHKTKPCIALVSRIVTRQSTLYKELSQNRAPCTTLVSRGQIFRLWSFLTAAEICYQSDNLERRKYDGRLISSSVVFI